MAFGIRTKLNKFTPGMTFGHYARKVLYKGEKCGYIEEAGKRKYVLTPVLNKLENKLQLNGFASDQSKFINTAEFNFLKKLLKPLISNEKGLKKLNLGTKELQYTPSPASIVVWDKEKHKPVITVVKELENPTREVFFYRFPCLRKIWRISPYI